MSPEAQDGVDLVLGFLACETPAAWVEAALESLPALLCDHAALELKAAQQAQKLIWRYAMRADGPAALPSDQQRRLRQKLSRLAREELRHYEQVLTLLERRAIEFVPVTPSRYAARLHDQIADVEPARLLDTLIVCAVIEARSCERFHALVPGLRRRDAELARFYASLLESESRHFREYLDLARASADAAIEPRIAELLAIECELVAGADTELRFHSGVVAARQSRA